MIYFTGDTHSDFTRFSTDRFPEQKNMSKNDYVDSLSSRHHLHWQ